MPVPKRKRSRARRDKRFANKGLQPKSFTECANCKEPIATHSACRSCGFYKGQKVLASKADRDVKRAQARKEKEAHAKEAPQDASGESQE